MEETKPDQEMSFWDKALDDSKRVDTGKSAKSYVQFSNMWPRREWPCFLIFHRWTKWHTTYRFSVLDANDEDNKKVPLGHGVEQERVCEKCGYIQLRQEIVHV